MGYWVCLIDSSNEPCEVEEEGKIIAASLNVPYSFNWFYDRILGEEGLKQFDGKIARDSISILEKAVKELGTDRYYNDIQAPTPGNAGHNLANLLNWAKQRPEGKFEISVARRSFYGYSG